MAATSDELDIVCSRKVRHRLRVNSAPFFTLGSDKVVVTGDDDAARSQFESTRAIICHEALSPALTARLGQMCDRSAFVSDQVDGLGHRRIEQPAVTGTAIRLMLSNPTLFRWLETVTGCGPISRVDGRVVQTYPVAGDELTWHDDLNEDRRLAITIALDSPSYDGGEFELRRVGETENLLRFRHRTPGTALIFTVSPDYEHRLMSLTGGGPRRVFAGWFLA